MVNKSFDLGAIYIEYWFEKASSNRPKMHTKGRLCCIIEKGLNNIRQWAHQGGCKIECTAKGSDTAFGHGLGKRQESHGLNG